MELTPNMLRAYHRAPTLKSPLAEAIAERLKEKRNPTNANPTHPQVPLPEPIQQAPALDSAHAGEAQVSGCAVPSVAGRPRVSITHRRVRLLDVEARYAACKDTIDALRYCGAIPDDREEDITLEVTQERVAHFKDEQTIVTIDYAEL